MDVYTTNISWQDASSMNIAGNSAATIPTILNINNEYATINLTAPAFPGRDWCFSIYTKGAATTATVGGITSTASKTGSWERVVLAGTATGSTLPIKLSNLGSIAGLQLTWGTKDPQPWVPGAGIATGIITELSTGYAQLVDDVLAPCNFTIQETPR